MSSHKAHSHSSTVDESQAGMRLDKYISDGLRLFSRSQIAHRNVSALVNGNPAKLSHRLASGDTVELTYEPPQATRVEPEDLPLEILYEDDDVIVINKAAGMVVHPAAGHRSGTVVQALLHHIAGLSERFTDSVRPGIVHRLDRDTSGVLIAGKHPEAVEQLARQFKTRTTRKTYVAMVKGQLPAIRGVIEGALGRDPNHRKRFTVVSHGGKSARTEYQSLHQEDDYSLVQLEPRTGRTHQLRVHMAHIGHPIVGDPVYSRASTRFAGYPLMLHAACLELELPSGRRERFCAPLPPRFLTVWPANLHLR